MWSVRFSSNATKEKRLLKDACLEKRVKTLLLLLQENPFQNPPPYEKLIGNLQGYYARRINVKHRLVYRVDEEKHLVIVDSMFYPYER